MKKLILITLATCLFSVAFGQETKTIRVEKSDKAPGKFLIVSKTVQLDGTTFEVTSEAKDTATFQAETLRRVKELEMLSAEYKRLAANADTMALSLIDGLETQIKKGAYNDLLKAELLNDLQGAWTLTEKKGAVTKTFQITITENNFTNGTATGTITITDKNKFTIAGFFASPLVLTKAGDKFTGNILSTTYILEK